ncbi:hypothetical protein Tco_0220604, partial [Tanacetum coccineum]
DQDDLEIPDLEDNYDNPNDGIFTNASYVDEGAVADFTNLEAIVNTNPSPRPSTTTHILDSIPEGSGGNHGGQSSSDRSLPGNEGGMTLQTQIVRKEILEETVDVKGVCIQTGEETCQS